MYMQGSYLRVLTPRTTNGTNLLMGQDGRAIYKEAHLPMSAKHKLELYNRKTPNHLKKIIEVVEGNNAPVIKNVQIGQPNQVDKLLEELSRQRQQMQSMQESIEKLMAENLNLQNKQTASFSKEEVANNISQAQPTKPQQTLKPQQPIK